MAIALPELPFSNDALIPHISPETIQYHYGKHHKAYVAKLNAAIENTEFASMSLEEIIKKSSGAMFNNAAQVFNHTFYWNSLNPKSGGLPSGDIATAINSKWGSFGKFKEEFSTSAATNFGSGWTWLIKNRANELEILNTDDAECPITNNHIPILTLDIWEHAYYIDYRNERPKYIEAFWNIVNWDFANLNFSA
jgi:Fe-Mn family superoxide dismutase